jgi:hypothetical protein
MSKITCFPSANDYCQSCMNPKVYQFFDVTIPDGASNRHAVTLVLCRFCLRTLSEAVFPFRAGAGEQE